MGKPSPNGKSSSLPRPVAGLSPLYVATLLVGDDDFCGQATLSKTGFRHFGSLDFGEAGCVVLPSKDLMCDIATHPGSVFLRWPCHSRKPPIICDGHAYREPGRMRLCLGVQHPADFQSTSKAPAVATDTWIMNSVSPLQRARGLCAQSQRCG